MLSPHKTPYPAVLEQNQAITGIPLLGFILDAMPEMVMILNKDRQLVFGNRAFLGCVGIGIGDPIEPVLGTRSGDILGCVHALESSGGCGTSSYCEHCGSFKALTGAIEGSREIEECRITRKVKGREVSMEMQVRSAPFQYEGNSYILFIMTDISQEKQNQYLGRIFFHDILNGLGGVKGALQFLSESIPDDSQQQQRLIDLALRQTVSMVDDIEAQKEILAAENRQLRVEAKEIRTRELLEQVRDFFLAHPAGKGITIDILHEAADTRLHSDPNLLSRVVGNMVKNALEASKQGDRVEITALEADDRVVFKVKNYQDLPEDVRLQLFKRSFSTKGKGRGLGTWSIKLLSEEYLGGKVWFETGENKGTTFYVALPKHLNQGAA